MTSQLKNTASDGNRAAQLTALLADAPKPDDHDGVRDYVHALAAVGLWVLLINPGTKTPFDGRTVRRRNADDRAARDEAREAGRSNLLKARSPSGVCLASNDPAVLDGYLAQYAKVFGAAVAVNVAVALGPSNLVVVDADTAEQRVGFLVDAGAPADAEPTVRTPGSTALDGSVAHHDGGHFWFTVPESAELPRDARTFTDSAVGYAVMLGDRYVLIPASTRPEGYYAVPEGGVAHELPQWLRKRIIEHTAGRASRARRAFEVADHDGPVSAWGASITWEEILADAPEWTSTGKSDVCGCDIWTAPGLHASTKSATAHEPGCSRFADSPDPPLYLWTDHDVDPFAHAVDAHGHALTRLRAVTAIHYDNDLGAAMSALDLHDDEPTTLTGGGEDLATTNLPREFWESRDSLRRIRDHAHARVESADAFFGALIAVGSAYVDPVVTVDTGVKTPMPLTVFTGLVGSSGTGKTSSFRAVTKGVRFTGLGDPADFVNSPLIAPGEVPETKAVGSGQGISEAYMGKDGKVRCQVRHKLLLRADEGASLATSFNDHRSTTGPVLRSAWVGEPIGEANASADRNRNVTDYSLGLCVGFQLEALSRLMTDEALELGSVQRFLYLSATDPGIPDDPPSVDDELVIALPQRRMYYSAGLMGTTRKQMLERQRGSGPPIASEEGQRPAMVARLAAWFAILDSGGERLEITEQDVTLAETVFDTSLRIQDEARRWGDEQAAQAFETRTNNQMTAAVATAAAVEGKDAILARLGKRIVGYIRSAGGTAGWGGRKGLRKDKFKGPERQLADLALQRLVDQKAVTIDRDMLTVL